MNLNRVKDEEEYTEYWYFELSCSLETQGAFLYLFWLFWKRPEGFGSFISLLRWGRRGHETLSSSKEDSNESEEKSSHVHREAHVQRCPQTSRDWWLCWCSSGWMFALHRKPSSPQSSKASCFSPIPLSVPVPHSYATDEEAATLECLPSRQVRQV